MPRLSDQELAALLEAASKGPWEAVRNAVVIGTKSVLFDEEAGDADLALAALAPALAQEVLDLREAGGELAEAMEEYERMWEAANACPECVGSLCADHALKLILARTTAKDALARWAELAETEVRDGLL